MFRIPYHKDFLEIDIPEEKLLGCFEPRHMPPVKDVPAALRAALRNPRGTLPLRQLAQGSRRAVIVIDDSTRPVPNALLVDAVMEELCAAALPPERVTVVAATGRHRPMTAGEVAASLGDWKGRIGFENHDARARDRLVRMGTTRLGTEVWLNRTFIEADLKILTGDVEYHQFCGYGGGGKSIFPGLTNAEAIESNHARMEWPGTGPGRLAGNPVRGEIDEAARMAGCDIQLSIVLDACHRLVSVHCGSSQQAFLEACGVVDSIYRIQIPARADLVIASPGGYPKDATLYQAQKALSAAIPVVEPGGAVLIAAACREGSGSAGFEQWMEEAFTPQDIVDRIGRSFEMGGHKAYQIAREVQKAQIHWYSMLPPGKVRCWFMKPLRSWPEAQALVRSARRVSVLPQATLTLAELAEPAGEVGKRHA